MIKRFTGLLAIFMLSLQANAALIDNGAFVTDDVAGVDYLKSGNTVGFSWNQIVTSDSLGLIAAGWSVASQSMLSTLDSSDASAYGLINNAGSFFVVTNNDTLGGQTLLPIEVEVDEWLSAGVYNEAIMSDSADAFDLYAVMLSRMSPVPLPAAGYFFVTALAGLIGGKRFVKK